MIRLAVTLLCLVLPHTLQAEEFAVHKGLNLSSWLANAPRQPLYERDFIRIKKAGFDNVRLAVNPEQFGFTLAQGSNAPMDFTALDGAITLAHKQGLSVVLDIHPLPDFMHTLEENDWAQERFIALWRDIAAHYAHAPAPLLAFGLLNEPQYYHAPQRYHALVERLIKTVHASAPEHTIIIGAPFGSSLAGLTRMEPFKDAHLLYDFHFYEPYIVTHQGIHQGFEKEMIRYFRGVPYPSSRAQKGVSFYAPAAPRPMQAAHELAAYVDEGWNAEKIRARIDEAAKWGAEHTARVICGEFGALRNHIDADSRYRWIADTRQALEADAIGWQLWDYTDLFGITELKGETVTDPVDGSIRLVNPEKGVRVIEPEALKALGLP